MIKLKIELSGVDPLTGNDISFSKLESNGYSNDIILHLINKALDDGASYSKTGGLDGLVSMCPKLLIAIFADEEDGFRPAFYLDPRVITRLCAAGITLDFDPYVYN